MTYGLLGGPRDRWMAEVSYLDGRPPDVFAFCELRDLHDLIERGPNWNEIDRIVVTLNRPSVEPAGTK
jgi:hypothetical protein